MDALADIPWGTVSVASMGWLLVALFVRALINGGLVSRTTHEDVIHDRNEWRAESRIKDAQISVKDEQLGYLAEVGETQKALLSSIDKLRRRDAP